MALKLLAEISLDGAGFERGVRRVMGSLKNIAVSAVGIYSIKQAFQRTIDVADELVNTSKRLGVPVEQLQVLREAAKETGVEMDKLAGAFEKMNVARSKALAGGPEGNKLRGRFASLGITDSDLRTQTASGLFTNQFRTAAMTRSAEDIGPIFRDVLGRGFGELLPVLQSDFGELEDKMRRFGAIMDTETAVKLDAIGDHFTLLSQIIVVQVAPALLKFVESMLVGAGKVDTALNYIVGGVMGSQITKKDMVRAAVNGVVGWVALAKKFNTSTARQAASEASTENDAGLAALRDRLSGEADKLNNPVAPAFDPDDLPGKRIKMPTDSLIRVGNFLGQGQADRVGAIAEKQLDVSKRALAEAMETNRLLRDARTIAMTMAFPI